MDRLDAMAVLIAVVEEGSLSAGARRLRSPVATVSRKVSELEEQLGTRLLVRTSRHLALTEAGRHYLDAARRILEQVDEAERAAAGEYTEPRGDLVVTAATDFARRHILPLAAEFLATYPQINLRLVLGDQSLNLVEEHVHVAIRVGHLGDSALVASRVGWASLVACASPAYLARRGVPHSPDDLREHDGVTFRSLSPFPMWTFEADGAPIVVEPRPRLVVNDIALAVEAALAGVGIVRAVSYNVAEEIASGRLVPVLQAFAPKSTPISLVHPGGGLAPLKVRAFLAWMAPRLRARLG
ncbi:MAG TPA: LysR family transcriptional regulator [Microvirga sp.]|jgi:DNA-binding transcriptional LysR family regulator|nr:LysR family transcriptional regulator [Microvirga sp.]